MYFFFFLFIFFVVVTKAQNIQNQHFRILEGNGESLCFKKQAANYVPDTSQRSVKRILQSADLLKHMRVETFEIRKNLIRWQLRIFVLDTELRTLCNYKNDTDIVPHNVIDLRQSGVSVSYSDKDGTMEITSPDNTIVIRAIKDKKKLQQFSDAITGTIKPNPIPQAMALNVNNGVIECFSVSSIVG